MRPIAVLLLLSSLAAAQQRKTYVTQMGKRILALSDVVAVAEIATVNPPFRGVSTARVQIESHLAGIRRDRKTLTIIYVEDYLAPDALRASFESSTVAFRPKRSDSADRVMEKATSAAANTPETKIESKGGSKTPGAGAATRGVKLLKGERGIFFLRRRGASYALVGIIRDRDPLYERKKKRLIDTIGIESVPTEDGRFRAAKSYYLRGLQSKDLWDRGNAAREIEGLARTRGGSFNAKDRRFLAERLYVESNESIASRLERAVRNLAPGEALGYAVEAEERERARYKDAIEREEKVIARNKVPELRAADLVRLGARYGRAATQTLCAYLVDPEPVVRESVAGVLSRHGGPSCRPPLRAALLAEKNTDAARAMIHTLGVKSDPEAVALIAARLVDRDLERTAVQALARIGTDDAWVTLQAHRPKASAAARAQIDSLRKDNTKAR